jgi:hypothetical protein
MDKSASKALEMLLQKKKKKKKKQELSEVCG